jgi:hypothetical protein
MEPVGTAFALLIIAVMYLAVLAYFGSFVVDLLVDDDIMGFGVMGVIWIGYLMLGIYAVMEYTGNWPPL